jgi:hypothetical protein
VGKLTEQQLVQRIIDFFNRNPGKKEMHKTIEDYVKESNLDESDQAILRSALEVQFQAWQHVKIGGTSNCSGEYIVVPYWYAHEDAVVDVGYSGSRGGGRDSGPEAYVLAGFVCPICSTALASYGMKNNLVEMGMELINNQRVAANLATLGLTSAYIIAAVMAVTAILATNPVGWGVVAALAGVAALVSTSIVLGGIRYLANKVDAANTEGSGLAKDSRFQLTPKEIERLREYYGISPEQINSLKGMIRTLAINAHFLKETGVFGSNDKYLEVIKVLMGVKKGNIPKSMQDQYQLGSWKNKQVVSSPVAGVSR